MRVTKEKRDVRCSHRRVLLLNCAWKPSSGMLFKRINVISTLRGNFVSSVCPIQTIQRAKTRRIKTRTRTKTSSTRRRKTQRERERENKTHAAVILPTILIVSQRGKFFRDFFMMCLSEEKEKKRRFFISEKNNCISQISSFL